MDDGIATQQRSVAGRPSKGASRMSTRLTIVVALVVLAGCTPSPDGSTGNGDAALTVPETASDAADSAHLPLASRGLVQARPPRHARSLRSARTTAVTSCDDHRAAGKVIDERACSATTRLAGAGSRRPGRSALRGDFGDRQADHGPEFRNGPSAAQAPDNAALSRWHCSARKSSTARTRGVDRRSRWTVSHSGSRGSSGMGR